MNDLRAAAQQALRALGKYNGALTHFNEVIDHEAAITALREALDAPVARLLNRDRIIRMALKSGCFDLREELTDSFERFAALVAEAEREACARVCDAIDVEYEGEDVLATWCAAAIRARGSNE